MNKTWVSAVLAVVSTLVSFYLVAILLQPENCWDKYSTEQEAIMNCEGVNK